MRAIVVDVPGGPEALVEADVPDPVAGPGEVGLEGVAAGGTRAGLLQRQGRYPPPAGAPEWPGLECSGRVIAVGGGVTEWSVGDEACALPSGGGCAGQGAARPGAGSSASSPRTVGSALSACGAARRPSSTSAGSCTSGRWCWRPRCGHG